MKNACIVSKLYFHLYPPGWVSEFLGVKVLENITGTEMIMVPMEVPTLSIQEDLTIPAQLFIPAKHRYQNNWIFYMSRSILNFNLHGKSHMFTYRIHTYT